jgi:hypothetical protein
MHDTEDCCRRTLLKAGTLALLSLGLPGRFFAGEAFGLSPDPTQQKYDSVIQVFMTGGPSQTDTWDPKPGSPNNIFNTIDVGAKDIYGAPIKVAQHFPNLVNLLHNGPQYGLGILRSVVHGNGSHDFAQMFMNCFWQSPVGENYPSTAAVMQYYLRDQPGIGTPSVLVTGDQANEANDAKGAPIETAFGAAADATSVDALTMPAGVDATRLARRQQLLSLMDDGYLATHPDGLTKAWPGAVKRAFSVTKSGAAAKAFDLSGKTLLPCAAGGDNGAATRLTLAQELVKVGVPYVCVAIGGNDTHTGNRARVTSIWGETVDPAVSAMARNLAASGKRVLVVMGGEFGRTPETVVGGRDGRDHHPDGFSWALLSINQPLFKTTAIGDTGPDGMWTRGAGNLKDWLVPAAIGGILYRVLGYPVGSDPRYDIPTRLGVRPPLDTTYVLPETDPYPLDRKSVV